MQDRDTEKVAASDAAEAGVDPEYHKKARDSRKFPWLATAIAAGILIFSVLLFWGQSAYLQTQYNATQKAWANVETQLQRQLDLIPNIAAVATEFSDRELEGIKELQNLAQSYQSSGDAQTLIAMQSLLQRFQETISSKSGQLYENLQTELAGTQNRIAVARSRYNDAVGKYEDARTVGLSGMVASIQGRPQVELFRAQPEALSAPKLFES